jgi:hypothetical protein
VAVNHWDVPSIIAALSGETVMLVGNAVPLFWVLLGPPA